MKTRKVLALAGVTLLAAGVLAACSGGSGAQGEKTFVRTPNLMNGSISLRCSARGLSHSGCTPASLGALLAHFENKIMFQGFLWNVNIL